LPINKKEKITPHESRAKELLDLDQKRRVKAMKPPSRESK